MGMAALRWRNGRSGEGALAMRQQYLLGGMMVRLAAIFAVIFMPVLYSPAALANPEKSDVLLSLQDKLSSLAARARPGVLGVTIIDLRTGDHWGVNQDQPFAMMSVFKAPVAAAVLDRVDQGLLSLQASVIIQRNELRPGASDIARTFQGQRMNFTVEQLLAAAVSKSDNTAVDALVRQIGGVETVARFLKKHQLGDMHVEMEEGAINEVFSALPSGQRPPVNETAHQRNLRLWHGYQDFLQNPRNPTTPDAAALFLQKLWKNELLSPKSTQHLLALMYGQTKPLRLRAGLPAGAALADKCGTSISMNGITAAFNDIGIVSWPDGHAVIIAAFLAGSDKPLDERTDLFSKMMQEVAFHTR
ncbi:class A beta-lactamase [Radicibacter daui]|uniref:class A beta-lactamase n=1 Tax=Radicibacter daui TaxID=3064829 RepID=UPI004046E34F